MRAHDNPVDNWLLAFDWRCTEKKGLWKTDSRDGGSWLRDHGYMVPLRPSGSRDRWERQRQRYEMRYGKKMMDVMMQNDNREWNSVVELFFLFFRMLFKFQEFQTEDWLRCVYTIVSCIIYGFRTVTRSIWYRRVFKTQEAIIVLCDVFVFVFFPKATYKFLCSL